MEQSSFMGSNSIKEDLLQYAAKRYGTQPEYLWLSLPNYAVLRHADNRKWYALLMDVPGKNWAFPAKGFLMYWK